MFRVILLLAVLALLAGCAGGYRYETARLDSAGVEVNNLVYLPEDIKPSERYPAVVLCHGGQDGVEFATRGWARELARRGYVVVLPQFRGQGGSGGHFDFGRAEVDDALAALRYAGSLGYVDGGRVALVGYSLGGLVAIKALVRSPEVKAAVFVSALSDPVDYFECRVADKIKDSPEQLARHRAYSEERAVIIPQGCVKVPVLILHGEDDRTVGVGQSRRLYDKLKGAGADVTLRTYPNIGHETMWYDAPRRDTIEFLDMRVKGGIR